jgi:hypothetical protein
MKIKQSCKKKVSSSVKFGISVCFSLLNNPANAIQKEVAAINLLFKLLMKLGFSAALFCIQCIFRLHLLLNGNNPKKIGNNFNDIAITKQANI